MLGTDNPKEHLEMLLRTLIFDLKGPLTSVIGFTQVALIMLQEGKTEQETIIEVCEIPPSMIKRLLDIMKSYAQEIPALTATIDITHEPILSNTPLQIMHYIYQLITHKITLLYDQAANISSMTSTLSKATTREAMKPLVEALSRDTKDVIDLTYALRDKYSYTRRPS